MEEVNINNQPETSQQKKRKKGVINKDDYKSEVIKKARISGSAYTSYSGKSVPERAPGNSCKCKHKCFQNIDEDERLNTFKKFVDLGTKNEQDCYLQSLMALSEIKRRRRRKENSSKPDRAA
ncbi:uncharacterized protein LOC124362896 [Homalodisca vitripennis]|uniref:uncharacterized protein LOC124362896 n=1 Tax=Homalodisca vitripennis TaxID=197043 RepID=UPI001EEC5A5E|nr:uncharacterized protein LOC124362896 [Homalodisca vitripennis]